MEFTLTTSAVTSKADYVLRNCDFDIYQEIARSSFADMLHDTERNKKYELALAKAITAMHNKGKPAHVLDIGTGTGLLSMMAARNGADTVTACEAFEPIAECARLVIARNGLADKIKVIGKRSTDLLVGPDLDMERKANILVAEVFDTELIGEGAIETFSHAHRCLLTDDCIVVPTVGNMYILPVQSDSLWRHNELLPITVINGKTLRIPPDCSRYDNSLAAVPLHDAQLSQLPPSERIPLTAQPIRVFKFDFGGRHGLPKYDKSEMMVAVEHDGTCHALLMWWDLEFDSDGEILLSCAPSWAAAAEGDANCQWRDHWMQAIFYPTRPLAVIKGQTLVISSQHDEYSLAFDVRLSLSNDDCSDIATAVPLSSAAAVEQDERGGGRVGSASLLHCALTRLRLNAANDADLMRSYAVALQTAMYRAVSGAGRSVQRGDCGIVTDRCVCLCASDGSLLPLLCAALGATKVWAIECGSTTRTIIQSLVDFNGLSDRVVLVPNHSAIPAEELQQVDVFVAEPYFRTTVMPWDNLFFWYVRSYVASNLPPHVTVIPSRGSLMAVALQFSDLWKIRAPVRSCEGFDLTIFDEIVEEARSVADSETDALPLWEYPAVALSNAFCLLEFDFADAVDVSTLPMTAVGEQPLLWTGNCNGVAMWMEYDLCGSGAFGDKDDATTTATRVCHGPRGGRAAVRPGEMVDWVTHCRQAVYLLPRPVEVNAGKSLVKYAVRLHKKTGDFECSFSACTAVQSLEADRPESPACSR